jgi:hypothetical protein
MVVGKVIGFLTISRDEQKIIRTKRIRIVKVIGRKEKEEDDLNGYVGGWTI